MPDTVAADWLIVETLDSSARGTVIADGCRQRNWASLVRARAYEGSAATKALGEVVDDVVASRKECAVTVRGARDGSPRKLVAVPVLGARNHVHGVHVWIGQEDELLPERRVVAAWEWDTLTLLAHHGPGIEEDILGVEASGRREVRMPTDFFSRVVQFDRRTEYFELCQDVANPDVSRV